VLSKGHAALIQYACLCEKGFFPREELTQVKTLSGLLQGHPDLSIPGIEAVTGSLGQGLSVGLGMALALRLDKSAARVYVIMGDGEQSEGQLWEASQAAANFKVDNLTAFLDWNKVQATGPTKDIFNIPDLDKKWSAFGWEVINAEGHDPASIIAAIEKAEQVKGRPALIILDTVKGKGFSFAEGNAAYHNGIMDEKTYNQALEELDAEYQKFVEGA
jgi:transketolase